MGAALYYIAGYVTRENLKDSFAHAGIEMIMDLHGCDRDNVVGSTGV